MKRFKVRQSSEAVFVIEAENEENIRRAYKGGDAYTGDSRLTVLECLNNGENAKVISIEEIP